MPEAAVVEWFSGRPASTLYLSVLTLGELRKGIEGVSDAKRRMALTDWLETDLPASFAGRVLAVDTSVADRWVDCCQPQVAPCQPLTAYLLLRPRSMACAWSRATRGILLIWAWM